MIKMEEYRRLVNQRKACQLCKGLYNPASVGNGKYDSNEIGPWSLWQSNLNANLLVVGQDWGDVRYFENWQGQDQPSGNQTNENLRKLLQHIGINIENPRDSQNSVIFLTNIILCLKTGGLQAPVDDDWFRNCSRKFFKPLIEIINPRAILALGKKVSESILNLYNIHFPKNEKLLDIMNKSPYQLSKSTVLFPLYHCGAGSINRNRSMSLQETDWSRITQWMKDNNIN